MKKKSTDIYRENFIKAVKYFMAEKEIDTVPAAADMMKVHQQTLYKIMDRSRMPTIEHGILLCTLGGFSANWMFLNIGEIYMADEAGMEQILKELKQLKNKVESIAQQA